MVSETEVNRRIDDLIERLSGAQKVLLLPPDFTRAFSGVGRIAARLYEKLNCRVDIMPALGTHEAMTSKETTGMFLGAIPPNVVITHNWREDVVKIGEIPADYIAEISDGLMNGAIDVEVNKRLVSGEYDAIISIGQVVPHEVAGLANYTKNIFVGCGGSSMISSTHMLGAVYGIENTLGIIDSPVRKAFDYAERFIQNIPIVYILTVSRSRDVFDGLFIGTGRDLFTEAATLSREKNIFFVDEPLKRVVCYMDPAEYKSSWVANKAIYRTRMAIGDGGELLVIAPGVKRFGEDLDNDKLIRRIGFVGCEKTAELVKTDAELGANLSVAAHIMHSSTEGRFSVTYASQLTPDELSCVGFAHMDVNAALEHYAPEERETGFYADDFGEYFFIRHPAAGLWMKR